MMKDVTCQLTHKRPQNYEICTDNKWIFYELLNPQRKIPYNKEKLCENGGIMTVDLRDGPGSDPYRCQCPFGFTGRYCSVKLIFSSCEEAMRNASLKDGMYLISTNTLMGYSKVFCMRKITGCSGEGWTLVLKIDGTKLWSNKESYMTENGETGLDQNETKLPTYWSTKIKLMCVGMKVNSTIKFISFEMQAKSLYDLIADGKYRKTNLSRSQWLTLVKNSSLQQYCNKEGFNVVGENRGTTRVKLGILGNNENDCKSPDSFIGFGGSYEGNFCGRKPQVNSCGNIYYCSKKNKEIKAMGYLFIA
ncbi:uncharacterized skeletal organic matrix protein 5-like isoform X2 [Xenia sp. Carnegie-2017]|uniref:uncharacterized skeletal organic matrix protein 5-like isoform X2 n=1 Tax=Xenia sp. Carnegie-2017 TaxID=2897299 RepID=UPI001F045969|nr:uncharacterized skeletal organic matrix protein 5-like isoform X2 [Xenia sp. Carnegie-2017]